MLSENLKIYRKKCGYTQEEVAEQLHVVRQTLSKWEKGISVPDADLLIQLAKIYDVSVDELLETTIDEVQSGEDEIARELAKLNEQLAARNRRSRMFWRIVLVLGVLIFFWGGSSIIFAVRNYEMILNDSTYVSGTGRMVLESCMLLFRKGALRAVLGLALTLAAGFMKRKR